MPKVLSDKTHLILYIVPEEKMIDSKGQKIPPSLASEKSVALYSNQILKITQMHSFSLERLDFTPYPRKPEPSLV